MALALATALAGVVAATAAALAFDDAKPCPVTVENGHTVVEFQGKTETLEDAFMAITKGITQ